MKSFQTLKFAAISALFVFAFTAAVPHAQAQDESPQGLMPPQTTVSVDGKFHEGEETHPPLRLTPDRSEIIEVEEDIGRVIIGSEVHMNILMDSPRRLVVVPRVPGATYFTLLRPDGRIIMQRYAIVANPKEKYIRIREPCRGADECMPIRMFYCPGLCHEIAIQGEGGAAFSGSITADSPEEGPQTPPNVPPSTPPSTGTGQ